VESKYSFLVNTAAPDYPYPLKYLKGSWEVEEVYSAHTGIVMSFELVYKRKFHNLLLHPILKSRFQKTAEELLKNRQVLLEKIPAMKEKEEKVS
jgi:ribosome-associated toxin RatA of RatAB toxin-antitoxin module